MSENQYHDPAEQNHREARQSHWDAIARKRDSWRGMGVWYHRRIEQIYRFLISPGQRVLEIGSGTGDLLATVQPASGVGVDFSSETITRARECYPEIVFIQADAHDLSAIEGTFDTIILSDLINELWDVQQVLEQVKPFCTISYTYHYQFLQPPVGNSPLLNPIFEPCYPDPGAKLAYPPGRDQYAQPGRLRNDTNLEGSALAFAIRRIF